MPLVREGRLVGSLVSPRTAKEYALATNGANAAEMPESLDMAGGKLSASDALAALDSGTFYSSAGPVLHDVTREGEHVEVKSSPCRSIVLVSGNSIGAAVNAGRLGYVHRGRVVASDTDFDALLVRIPDPAHTVVEFVNPEPLEIVL